MKILIKGEDGTNYEAVQINTNTFTFKTEDKTFGVFISELPESYNLQSPSKELTTKITEAIFSNKDILDQLNHARKNRDKNFSYYSGDEEEFDKLVDEVNNDE